MSKQSRLVEFSENENTCSVTLKSPTRRYMDEFIKLKCAPDLISMRLFPNAKEITESMAAYKATRFISGKVNLDFGNPNIAMVCVGDGNTPRTAALFAFRSRWDCYSVDPRLGPKRFEVAHLHVRQEAITAASPIRTFPHDAIIIVLVHSHALLPVVLDKIVCERRHVIAIPCCVPNGIITPARYVYDDWGIWSPHRTVSIWTNI